MQAVAGEKKIVQAEYDRISKLGRCLYHIAGQTCDVLNMNDFGLGIIQDAA